MVELFADLPPGHEFFEQFSFISRRRAAGIPADGVARRGGNRRRSATRIARALLSLPFKLIAGADRLGLIDDRLQDRILEARRVFAESCRPNSPTASSSSMPRSTTPPPRSRTTSCSARSPTASAGGAERIGECWPRSDRRALDLRGSVIEGRPGSFDVGVAGSAAVGGAAPEAGPGARLLRNPDVLIVNEATAVLDRATQGRLMPTCVEERQGRGVIWAPQRASPGRGVRPSRGHASTGRLVEKGHFRRTRKERRTEAQLTIELIGSGIAPLPMGGDL